MKWDKKESRTIKDNKQERKKYIEQCKGYTVQDIIKIRLHMWDLKKNYKKEEEQPLRSLCEIERYNRTCAQMRKRCRQKAEEHQN